MPEAQQKIMVRKYRVIKALAKERMSMGPEPIVTPREEPGFAACLINAAHRNFGQSHLRLVHSCRSESYGSSVKCERVPFWLKPSSPGLRHCPLLHSNINT